MARLNYNHLHYFWAVARDGNLTRTAETLGVSQSALSLQIKKLEDRLGQQLFERRGKQLVLTEAGTIALDHADVIFAAGDEMLATLSDRGDGRERVFRVGALSTLSRNFQAAFLKPVFDDGVRASVRSGSLAELTTLLQAQKLDVVLTNQAAASSEDTPWIAHPLAEQTVELIGYPGRGRRGASVKHLLTQEPLILPSKDSGIRHSFDALMAVLLIEPKIAAEVDDMALLRVLARQDVGLAVVPPIVVRDELASGRLVEVAELAGLTETFFALTMPRRFPHPALERVLRNRDLELASQRTDA
ncbi:MAG: LysR family transcriptional regulator [Pseudomonadota bacterium]